MRHFTTLIDANTLSEHLSRDDLTLFDCRFDLGNVQWGETEFARAHVPGAIYLHLDRDLSGPVSATSGRHPLPDPEIFARRLGELGVSPDRQIVAYDQGNAAYAARLWWLARWTGLRNVAVLDGGLAAWRAAGLPVDTSTRTPQPRALTLSLVADAWVSSESVDELRLRPGNLLIDARGAERFAGKNETIDKVAGHVPGARNRPFLENLGADGRFLPVEVLRKRFGTLLGSIAPSSVIAMCGSGVTACHHLLALEHAGLTGARLYAGSWSEWIRDPRRPVATGAY
ncbi:MAG TPA: sulfurtransferase [Steroidobacteraceae bacterium]|nr:sulfurtransferase [Steroidobacteraceae bacterium]